ncbi:MAG: hypothetical protein R3D58_12165 [Saprospiraceae bacterium]
MHFTPDTIFHIYNQGNNRQQVFFHADNYLFFLKKMRAHLLPYGDLLCYCLMPNHFHWLLYVRRVEVEVPNPSEAVTSSHRLTVPPGDSGGDFKSPPEYRRRTLNESIAILLRSYTRAINVQENRSGSLFRKETKAKDGWEDVALSSSHPKYGMLLQNWELYGATCFNYILNNPVEANLVARAEDWPYSAAPDFAGLRKGTLCNLDLARELLFLR